MLRGLWEFRPINQKTLGFLMNDELLFIDAHARDKNWLRVASIHGHVGYVPINFVEILENVDLPRLLSFLDEAIRRARQDKNRSLDCLLSFRDGLVTSLVPPDEMIIHMESEIKRLRAKSISELSNENTNLRSSYNTGDHQEGNYGTTVHSTKASSGRIEVDETGSPQTGYHLRSHQHPQQLHQQHIDNSPHLQRHQYETESDLIASPVVPDHRTSHTHSSSGGYRTKSRGKKKKQGGNIPTVISSVEIPPPQEEIISYPAAIEIHGDHLVDYSTGQVTSLITDPISICPEISNVDNPVILSTINCEDVEIVPPPPMINNDGELQYVTKEMLVVQQPPSLFEIPDLTNQPRKWSIASGDKPVDPKLMAGEMIDVVRSATGLSHRKCQMAAQVVLGYIQECMPELPVDLISLMKHLDNPKAISENPDVIAHSSDAYSMNKIFRFLKKCQADEQQRSWALHEDEETIIDHLTELNKILEDADPSICRYALEQDKYNTVSTLVLYYQMETRWSIRLKLIDCFSSLCKIDMIALSVLLNSILPMELAREIRESLGDHERLCECASLLFLILQTGEKLPISHYDHLGLEFLNFVYDVIENPPDDDERITDVFVNVVFALNLQFKNIDDNLAITALSERANAKIFTQKIIYYLNREVDPINVVELDYKDSIKKPQHSVFKMTQDILSCKQTTDLFYTNDIKVLIDIVTRNLTDLNPGEPRRTLYLQMIQRIIRNSNYVQHMHRIEDLRSCLVSILIEEDLQALSDQIVIRDMAKEFSFLF